MKYLGKYKGRPMYEDPRVPPGTVYFLPNDAIAINRTRWQKLKDWIKERVGGLRKLWK